MAKGIRSKSMRKNRSYLRKTLVEPIMRQRAEKIAEKVRQIHEKQQPKTLTALKNLISVAKPQPAADDAAMEEEEEEEEEARPARKAPVSNVEVTRVKRGGRTIEVVTTKTKTKK